MSPLVLSIVIPVYNGAEHLLECLQAIQLACQPLDQSLEIIVVDDGSTDSTARLLQQQPVRVVTLPTNQGRAAARWAGAQTARAQQLLFLDSRVRIAPDFLQQLFRYLEHTDCIMAGGYQPQQEKVGFARLFYLIRRRWYGRHLWPSPRSSYWLTPIHFAHSPKGATALSLPKALYLEAAQSQPAKGKHQSDDTALLAEIVFHHRRPILRAKYLRWQYQPRQNTLAWIQWLLHRGQTFADFYLSPRKRLLWLFVGVAAVAVFVLGFLPAGLPWLLLLSLSTWLCLILLLAEAPTDCFTLAWQLPAATVVFVVGILMYYGQHFRRRISTFTLAGVVLWLIWYLSQHLVELQALSHITASTMGLLLGLYWLFYVVNGLIAQQILRVYDVPLALPENIALSLLTSLGNIFLPFRGGAGWRAWYLKRFHGLRLSHFLHALAATAVLGFLVTSLAACLGLLFLGIALHQWYPLLLLVYGGLGLGASLFLLLDPVALLPIWLTLPSKLRSALQGWRSLRHAKTTLVYVVGLNVMNLGLTTSLLWIELQALGVQSLAGTAISWPQTLLLATTGSLSLVISLTPAALGIREVLLMGTSQLMALNPTQIVAVSLLDRGINLLSLLLGAPLASWWLIRQSKRSPRKK